MKKFIHYNYILICKILITIYSLYALKYLFRLKNIESEFYMNVTFIFIAICVYLLSNYTINILKKGIEKRLLIISSIMGLYFSFVAILGSYYEGVAEGKKYSYETISDFTLIQLKASLIFIPAFIFLFAGCVIFIFKQIPQLYNNYIKQYNSYTQMPKIFNSIYKIWLFIFICWLPYFILLYPGYVNWDVAYNQIPQLFTGKFNTHHPILTTLYMYFIYFYYKISHNGILSMALYVVIFQMIPLSFIYAYMITKLNKIYNVHKVIVVFLILFLALYPVNPLISIIIEKGVVFIFFLILFMIRVIELVNNIELIKQKKYFIQLIIIGIILCLSRNNVIYGFAFVIPVMLFFAKKYRKYIFILFAGIFVGYILLNTAFIKITDASKGQFRESMSMPMQQLARVYKYHKDELNIDELKFIATMVKNEKDLNNYLPKRSDNVKSHTISQFFKTKEFIIGYIKLGIKYPSTYLNSFLIMSSAILYPFDNSFWWTGLFVGINDIKFINVSASDILKHKNKSLHSFISKKNYFVKKNNSMLSFILFNQSIWFYILIFALLYFMYTKNYKNIFILLIPLGYATTLFLGPIMYFRYTYYLMVIVPMIIMMLTNNKNNEVV